ncbi:metalloregulator ArsR/SmtB family transcription factor [Actinocorallia longicatena]|uniref:Metalloregulator ArsR/SmtB family transcription factor n=1 Tax=Actinocorallia longicatena TaxID=111803 RepID=A0ABP6QE42_9ACTN
MDLVFKALADPSRRRLLDGLNARDGQTLGELCDGLDMTRQSVSKHLAVLQEANLITTLRRGREKLHFLNAAPINEIADRWIRRYDRERVQALSTLKQALEEPSMSKPEFVYTTYITTTAERLWRALTEPAFTQDYWGHTLESTWAEGAPITWRANGVTIDDGGSRVLEYDPHRRLSYSWHTFTKDWSDSFEIDPDTLAKITAEPRSRVTFALEPDADRVRLTVTHDGFEEGSTLVTMVSGGWPSYLSSLKTLLEKTA